MNKNIEKWIVSYKEEGVRLVAFVKEKTKTDLSNRTVKTALEAGVCKVNNIVETFASKKLRKGDIIELIKRWDASVEEKEGSKKSPKVLYEDDYLIVIHKKIDFLCTDEEVQKYFPKCVLVHRLDKQTSGVLILAKSANAKSKMKALFRDKKVYKTYIAVVDGKVEEKRVKVESFLIKRKDSEGKILWMETRKTGTFAISVFENLKKRKLYSVMKCFPITGRTHQLRVHLLGLGHPILGDYQYFRDFKYEKFMPRLMLHSYQVEFTHPFLDKKIRVKSELPKEFKNFVTKI